MRMPWILIWEAWGLHWRRVTSPVGSAGGMSAISALLLWLEREGNVCSVERVGNDGSVVLAGCIRHMCE